MHCECCKHKEPLNGDWKMKGEEAYCSVACETYHGDQTCGCFAPGHTDMMVSPESLDAFMSENPRPQFSTRVMLCTCGKVLETPAMYVAHCAEYPNHFTQS